MFSTIFVFASLLLGATLSARAFVDARRARVASETLFVYVLLLLSMGLFTVTQVLLKPSTLRDILIVCSGAGCGFSWLYARALFSIQDQSIPSWCWIVVGLIFASPCSIDLMDAFGAAGTVTDNARRVALNINMLASSSALLLGLVEPLSSGFSTFKASEQRFRLYYAAGYAALMGAGVLWVSGASASGPPYADFVRVNCATLGVFGAAAALWFRSRHPMAEAAVVVEKPLADDVETAIAGDLVKLMNLDGLYTEPLLKVEDLALRLGVPEYRVTRAITGALGYKNFNQLVNSFRIEHAKSLLRDPSHASNSILSIAMDCGFNSLGPFNRAFKARCDQTPSEFRQRSAV
ncbi:MAG: AraC family transcriptional regulator [Pseudomonadota bacterium]